LKGVFVTGTDTGVGKTRVGCGLIHALKCSGLRVAGMKPVASGCEQIAGGLASDDARQLAAASALDVPMDLLNPYRFLPAIAPHVAAAESRVQIDLQRIKAAYLRLAALADVVVVEGVGGLRVPLGESEEVSDLIAMLGLPVILVVGIRLGCLNHALLTVEALDRRSIAAAGWVASHVDPAMAAQEENVQALHSRLTCPLLGRVPHLSRADPEAVAGYLDLARVRTVIERGAD